MQGSDSLKLWAIKMINNNIIRVGFQGRELYARVVKRVVLVNVPRQQKRSSESTDAKPGVVELQPRTRLLPPYPRHGCLRRERRQSGAPPGKRSARQIDAM